MNDEAEPSDRLPTLGPHGEGWVAIQILILVLIACAGYLPVVQWPASISAPLRTAGYVLLFAGIAMMLAGALSLNTSLTAMPKPVSYGSLKVGFAFRVVRHPIYGGLIITAVGWSLTRNPIPLIPSAVLALFFDVKSRREEVWLTEKYPEYADYRERVKKKFVPFVY